MVTGFFIFLGFGGRSPLFFFASLSIVEGALYRIAWTETIDKQSPTMKIVSAFSFVHSLCTLFFFISIFYGILEVHIPFKSHKCLLFCDHQLDDVEKKWVKDISDMG